MAWPVEEILEPNGISYEHQHEAMTEVAARRGTIYSYENTIVAEVDGRAVGAMCAYDGADYVRLKQPVVDILGPDSGFAQLQETEAGEFYLDSVGVYPSSGAWASRRASLRRISSGRRRWDTGVRA